MQICSFFQRFQDTDSSSIRCFSFIYCLYLFLSSPSEISITFATSHNTLQQSQLHTWQSQLHTLCQKTHNFRPCRGRSRSRSLKLAQFDRSYRPTTFHWSAIIIMYSSMVYHFRVILRWIIVTLKSEFEVTKVIKIGTIRNLGCGFAFAFHSNYGRIFNRLWDIQHPRIAWPFKLNYGLFNVIENGTVRQIIYDSLLVCHYKYSSILYHFRVIWRWIISWLWNRG